jgi:hypothetical protein
MALFDALDSDLDDIAARCTDDDAGVRRVAMLELAEVQRPRRWTNTAARASYPR